MQVVGVKIEQIMNHKYPHLDPNKMGPPFQIFAQYGYEGNAEAKEYLEKLMLLPGADKGAERLLAMERPSTGEERIRLVDVTLMDVTLAPGRLQLGTCREISWAAFGITPRASYIKLLIDHILSETSVQKSLSISLEKCQFGRNRIELGLQTLRDLNRRCILVLRQ